MCTARSLTMGDVPARRTFLGGVPAQGVPSWGVPAQGGTSPGTCPPPLWTEFLTHATENITLPQLRCDR